MGAGQAQQAGRDPRLARRRHPDRAAPRGLRGRRRRARDAGARRGRQQRRAGREPAPGARPCSRAHYPRLRVLRALPQSRPSASRARTSSTWSSASTPTTTSRAVIERLHAAEAACGRARDAPKWAPRSMDLDILLYGDRVCDEPGLRAAAARPRAPCLHARARRRDRAGHRAPDARASRSPSCGGISRATGTRSRRWISAGRRRVRSLSVPEQPLGGARGRALRGCGRRRRRSPGP